MGCFVVLFALIICIPVLILLFGVAFFGLTLLGIGILGTIPATIMSRTGRSAKWLFVVCIVLMVLGAMCTAPIVKLLLSMVF